MYNQHVIPSAFILSLNRSGSTLLSSMLNAHSQIIGLPESSFILNLAIHFQKSKYTNSDYEKILACLWIRMKAFEKVWNIDKTAILKKLQQDQPQCLEQIIKEIQLQYSTKKDISLIIDKNPIYNHFLNLLDSTFHGNKKIILIRDYCDRFHSLISRIPKTSYFKQLFHHFSWSIQMSEYIKVQEKNPHSVILIRFEDLILSTEETLEKICVFLGIPFEKNIIENRMKSIPNFSENIELAIKHKRTSQVLDLNQLNKSELIPIKDLKALHFFNSKLGKCFGYSLDVQLSLFDKTMIVLKHLPVLLVYRLFFLATKLSYYMPISIQKILTK
jgi:hypothetical protein